MSLTRWVDSDKVRVQTQIPLPPAKSRRAGAWLAVLLAALGLGCGDAPQGGVPASAPIASVSPSLAPSATVAVPSTAVASPSVATTLEPSRSPTAPAALGAVPAASLPAKQAAAFQAVLDGVIANKQAPGIAAAVVTDDGLWTGSAGLGQPVGDAALAPNAEFAIASITKTFVAALVLREVERGHIELDAPAARYLPSELAAIANGATIRQVLMHRSAIPEYFDPPFGKRVLADCTRTWTPKEAAALIPRPVLAPGAFSYSNSNYILLGMALETTTGETLRQLMRGMLDPIGLTRVAFQPEESPPGPLALPHIDADGDGNWDDVQATGLLPCRSFATIAWAAGGMAADAASLVRWGWLLYGGSVLLAESLAEMTTIAGLERYGLGTQRFPVSGGAAYGHSGAIDGYRSLLIVPPAERVAVVVLVNGEQDSVALVVAQRLVPGFAF